MKRISFYEEDIASGFAIIVTAAFILIAAFFLGISMYQAIYGPVGDAPAPNRHYTLMFLVFAGTALIVSNLRKLRIRIDEQGFRAAYGIFRQEYSWDDIESIAIDTASVFRYGGWGIRYTCVKGLWRRGYTVIGAPRVALALRAGRFRQFAFSTNRPEEVVRRIDEHLRG